MQAVIPQLDTPTKNKDYFIQLDGIRFIAVGLVLYDHLLADRNLLPLGALGVTIFFVLSGFLIVRILLSSKDKLSSLPGGGLGRYLKTFYIRRTLRIFPIYYLTLLVLAVANVPPVREQFGWLALYGTNIYMALHQTWLGSVDHLWSLAVEEQFYLFFPLVLFFVPRRWVLPLAGAMIVLSVALRYYFFRAGYNWVVPYVSLPTCLDSFGLGTLLAFLYLYRPAQYRRWFSQSWLVVLGILCWVGVVWLERQIAEPHDVYNVVLERLAGSVLGLFLIGKATLGFGGAMRWALENPVSQYLGRISYGIYLFHNFVYNHYHSPATHPVLRVWHRLVSYVPVLDRYYAFEVIYFVLITVAVAAVSWQFIERPINNLKERFSY